MQLPQTSSHQRFAVLDGIRGIAVLFVLVSHIDGSGLGQLGVWLFFVLSSFLLSLYFFEKPERLFVPIEWANYFVRRFLRIYPLFTLATIGGVIIGWWGWGALWPVLSLQDPGWWAIYVEFRFYFALPFVVLAFHAAGRFHRFAPPLLMAAAFAVHFMVFTEGNKFPGYTYNHDTIIAYEYWIVFITGCFSAWLYVETRDRLSRFSKSNLLDLCLAAGMIAPWYIGGSKLSDWLKHPVAADWYHSMWEPFGIYFAALIVGLMVSDGWTKWIVSSRPLQLCGLISYSMYLGMDLVIQPLAKLRPDWMDQYWLAVPVIAMAWLSFVVIERPISRISLIKSQRAPPFLLIRT